MDRMEDDTDKLLDELLSAEKKTLISPHRPQPGATATIDESDDSDDEFALPMTPCARATLLGTEAHDGAVGGEGASSAAAAMPAVEKKEEEEEEEQEPCTETDTAKSADSSSTTISSKNNKKPIPDQTKLENFQQVINQKKAFWDNITTGQLVWHKDQPAIVVHDLCTAPVDVPADGVMAYGPNSVNIEPAKKRFVVIQYFPLCLTCYDTPTTTYFHMGGKAVEYVFPYNTIMGDKIAAKDRKLGSEDEWASTDYHFQKLKNSKKGLNQKNWDASLSHAQKFVARALELRAELEENCRVEEELALQRQQRELQEREEAAAAAGSDGDGEDGEGVGGDVGSGAGAAPPAESKNQLVQKKEGLALKPGDRIFYWDMTKVVGLASSRREATILEIRSRRSAKAAGVLLLVLDNNEIVMDDWVIQRYIKDKDTGKVTLDPRGCKVNKHKLTTGKLEGSDPNRNKLMEALVADFREDIKGIGAGAQLRDAPKRRDDRDSDDDGDETSDDDEPALSNSTEEKSKTKAQAAKGGTVRKRGGGSSTGGGGGGGGGGSSGGGSVSVGRKRLPLDEEDEGHAIGASIAGLKFAKKSAGGGCTTLAKAKAKAKVIAKAQARAQVEVVKEKVTNKSKKTTVKTSTSGASKNRSSGAGGGEEGGGDPERNRASSSGGGGAGGGDRDVDSSRKSKKRKERPSPPSAEAKAWAVRGAPEHEQRQGPQKKKPKKDRPQGKSQVCSDGGGGGGGGGSARSGGDGGDNSERRKAVIAPKAPKAREDYKIPKKQKKDGPQSKSQVCSGGGGGGGSVRSGGDGGDNNSERRKIVIAPKAPKAPKSREAFKIPKFKPPRQTGTSDGPNQAVVEAGGSEPHGAGGGR